MNQIKKLFYVCTIFVFNCSIHAMITDFKVEKDKAESSESSENNKSELFQQTVQVFFNFLETDGQTLFSKSDKKIWTNQEEINETILSTNPLLQVRVAALVCGTNYKFFLLKLKNTEIRSKLENAFKTLLQPWEIEKIKTFHEKIKNTQELLPKITQNNMPAQMQEKIQSFLNQQALKIFNILVQIFAEAKIVF